MTEERPKRPVPKEPMFVQEMPDGARRELWAVPGYELGQQYGRHGMELWFVVKRKPFAIVWNLMTNWYRPDSRAKLEAMSGYKDGHRWEYDGLGGIDRHSSIRLNEYDCQADECLHLEGGECFASGTVLGGSELFDKFMLEGHDVVWKTLEEWLQDAEKDLATQQENSK